MCANDWLKKKWDFSSSAVIIIQSKNCKLGFLKLFENLLFNVIAPFYLKLQKFICVWLHLIKLLLYHKKQWPLINHIAPGKISTKFPIEKMTPTFVWDMQSRFQIKYVLFDLKPDHIYLKITERAPTIQDSLVDFRSN